MLKEQVLAIIIRRWKQGERTITSEAIYAELLQLGTSVPEDALVPVLVALKASKLIDLPHLRKSTRHAGSACVTWVSSTLLM